MAYQPKFDPHAFMAGYTGLGEKAAVIAGYVNAIPALSTLNAQKIKQKG